MAAISIRNLDKAYGKLRVLHDINLEIADNSLRGVRRPLGLRQVDAAAH